MDSQSFSQDTFLVPNSQTSEPTTPHPSHAAVPDPTASGLAKMQPSRLENPSRMTPPPSTQVPSSQRSKTRTPTPPVSHISTPPPIVDALIQNQTNRANGRLAATTLSEEQTASASAEVLRTTVTDLQATLQEAKMSAAHHRLQYQMLSQESAAAIERMGVEARMTQYENEVIHNAEQTRAAATSVHPSPMQEGTIPVQKDLYQKMCQEIQRLTEERKYLIDEQAQKDRTITRQEGEIASLGDRVTLMRERIRENREHMNRYRRSGSTSQLDSTPRANYMTPLRHGVSSFEQPQPFAALLQASEMASQEARRPTSAKKGHSRNTHSMSSLPSTPNRNRMQPPAWSTPHGRNEAAAWPNTAPQPRTSAVRTPPDVYVQPALPVTQAQGPPSDATVSGSDDNDSEAETDIIEQDGAAEVHESQASRAASQMLRSSQDHRQEKRKSFKGSGMLQQQQQQGGRGLKQTQLFGAVRKGDSARGDQESPRKRKRTNEGVGLGIAGMRS